MIPIRNRAFSPKGIVCHLACAALALCMPAAAWAETLADAVAAAYDRQPQLVQQRYLQKARDEGYVQARAQYGPTLTVQTSGGYQYQSQFGGLSVSEGTDAQTGVTVSQPLYTSGRLRGNLAAARANVLAGQEQLRVTEQQVVQNVISVYAAVLRDEARLEVGRENVIVLEGQLRQNTKRQQYGDVTLTDVAQSDSRLAAAQLQMASLEANLAVSRAQFLEVIGHIPGDLDPLPQLGTVPPTITAAFEASDANNPSLRLSQHVEEQSSATAASTRGEGGPTVSLSGQAYYANGLGHFDGLQGRKAAQGGFTVTQPLLDGGAIRSRVREADARNRADQAGIDLARRQALDAVTTAWAQLSAARIAIVTGQRQVESAQQAFAGMNCEELNGLRSTIETLNAEQELQSAQLQLLQSRYQVYVSHAALLAATGDLTAQSIVTGVAVYDPDVNFKRVRFRGATPLDLIAMAADRIGSASPRGPFSPDLAGANVPAGEDLGPLAQSPGRELMNKPLTPMTQSKLRAPNGDTARCPLTDIRRTR